MFSKYTVLFCLLLCLLYAQCPTSYAGDYLQSGKKTIVNFANEAYIVTTIVFFNSPTGKVQLAASLSSIDSYRPDLENGFKFSTALSNGNLRRFVQINLSIGADNSWKEVQVRYLLNGRTDIAVGNFGVDYKNAPTTGQLQAIKTLPSKLPAASYKVATFISGIYFSGKIGVELKEQIFTLSKDEIKISYLVKNFKGLKRIEFAYIIYPVAHPVLVFSYVSTPTGSGFYDIAGLTHIYQNQTLKQGQWKVQDRFLVCEGADCPGQCVRTEECTALNGSKVNGQCLICQKDKNGKCITTQEPNVIDKCPERSKLNLITFKCTCLFGDQYLINSKCQKCKQNQIFNGKECICNQFFYLINGQCRKCDPRSTYNTTSRDCQCNLGYFGDRDTCELCHQTCVTCTGSEASDCTACVDITFKLKDGFCTQEGPCFPGQFLNGANQCEPCSDYCTNCTAAETCEVCSIGFILESQQFFDQTFQFCQQICGDGRRFAHDCDDGNTVDGDGCSSSCDVQPGWFCIGSSTQSVSKCSKKEAGQPIVLESRKAVNLGNRVLHSVAASYLPDCVIKQQCSECYKIVDVKVIQGLSPIKVFVSYVPNSKYQFIIQYDFGTNFVLSSAFTVSIRLNSDFSECIRQEDLDRVYTATIDPSTLICGELVNTLKLDDIKTIEDVPQQCQKQFAFDPQTKP